MRFVQRLGEKFKIELDIELLFNTFVTIVKTFEIAIYAGCGKIYL